VPIGAENIMLGRRMTTRGWIAAVQALIAWSGFVGGCMADEAKA